LIRFHRAGIFAGGVYALRGTGDCSPVRFVFIPIEDELMKIHEYQAKALFREFGIPAQEDADV